MKKRGFGGVLSPALSSALFLACVGPRTPASPVAVRPPIQCRVSDALCLRFRNDGSSDFRVTSAAFVLDGVDSLEAGAGASNDESSTLTAPGESIVVWSGPITPGEHTLQVVARFQGNGSGAQAYLRAYKFDVKATHAFAVHPNERIELDVVSFLKGGLQTPPEERPDLKFEERLLPIAPPRR